MKAFIRRIYSYRFRHVTNNDIHISISGRNSGNRICILLDCKTSKDLQLDFGWIRRFFIILKTRYNPKKIIPSLRAWTSRLELSNAGNGNNRPVNKKDNANVKLNGSNQFLANMLFNKLIVISLYSLNDVI